MINRDQGLSFIEVAQEDPQPNLGYFYEKGRSVKQDYKEAARIYHYMAGQGNAAVQNNLGNLYKAGLGVTQDYKEAARLYRLSAEQGNRYAQFNLAGLYLKGLGVTQDYKKAADLYHLAADQENGDAQFNLACLHEHGLGVKQNDIEAGRLYSSFVDQELTRAIQFRKAKNDEELVSPTHLATKSEKKLENNELKATTESKEIESTSEIASSVIPLAKAMDLSYEEERLKLIKQLESLMDHYKMENKADHMQVARILKNVVKGEIEIHSELPSITYSPFFKKATNENDAGLCRLLKRKLQRESYEDYVYVAEFLLNSYSTENHFYDKVLFIKNKNGLGKLIDGEFKHFIQQMDKNKKELKDQIKFEIDKVDDIDERQSLVNKMITELPERYRQLPNEVLVEIHEKEVRSKHYSH